jgi:site-specific DNA-adenine methylase
MSIKKELLSQLSIQQLKKLAEKKGISFVLNKTQEEYYSNWDEKELMIDLMNDNRDISIHEIEEQIRSIKK